MMVHAADQSMALLVARYQIRIALIAMPTSIRTRADTGQSLRARPIRSYISSSTAGAAGVPDFLICSRIAAARSSAALPRYTSVSTGTIVIGPVDDGGASGSRDILSSASTAAPSKSLRGAAD